MTEEDPKQEQRGLPVAGCPVLHIRQEIVDLSVGMERRFRENASRGDPFAYAAPTDELLELALTKIDPLVDAACGSGFNGDMTPDDFWQKTYDACNYLLMAAKKYEKENE